MARDGIYIAFAQCRKHILCRLKAVDLLDLGQQRGNFAEKQRLRLCGCLYADALTGQIGQRLDIAVCTNSHDLTAVHIRTGPLVLGFPPVHAEA